MRSRNPMFRTGWNDLWDIFIGGLLGFGWAVVGYLVAVGAGDLMRWMAH